MRQAHWPGLRILELADEKGQFCGKLLGDLGADVVKIEPPGGERNRHVGPFLDDIPHPERSLSFWYYNTSKRGITLDLETADGRELFRRLAADADVILETFRPGFLASLGLGFETLRGTKPGADHVLADRLRPDRPVAGLPLQRPAAHGGGRRDGIVRLRRGGCAECAADRSRRRQCLAHGLPLRLHGDHGCAGPPHGFRSRAVYRCLHTRGVRADHRSRQIANYIYRGEVLRRQTGRHHAAGPTPRTQFRAKDGIYVCALVGGRLNPKFVGELADLLDSYGMAGDLKDPKYQDPAVIAANTSHIIDDLVAELHCQPAGRGGLPCRAGARLHLGRGACPGGAARRCPSARSRLLEAGGTPRARPQLHLSRRGGDL